MEEKTYMKLCQEGEGKPPIESIESIESLNHLIIEKIEKK